MNTNHKLTKTKTKKYPINFALVIVISVVYLLGMAIFECLDLNETRFQFLYNFVLHSEYKSFLIGKTLYVFSVIVVTFINLSVIFCAKDNIRFIKSKIKQHLNLEHKNSTQTFANDILDSFSGSVSKKQQLFFLVGSASFGIIIGIIYFFCPKQADNIRHFVTLIINIESAISIFLTYLGVHYNFCLYKLYHNNNEDITKK